jgi:hypothetical protein
MSKLLKNRLALSTAVTTLIILVVSVLLATVVVYFATNVISTRVQEESLSLTKQHIWVEMDGDCVAAVMITNIGGRDVVLGKVAVRGQAVDMPTQVWYVVADSDDLLTTDLNYTVGATIDATARFGGLSGAPAQPVGDNLVLPAGETVVVYVINPGTVSVNDIGVTLAITVFTSQAIYYKETNVEASLAPTP